MEFKDLTEKQIENISSIYGKNNLKLDEKLAKLSAYTGKTKKTVNIWLIKLGLKNATDGFEQLKKAQQKKHDKTKKRFIFTWAQNNTAVHTPFWNNILAYSEHIGASVHVIAGRYKNPTSLATDYKQQDFWVDELTPYLDANKHDIHKYLSILSQVKIQPTDSNPLSKLESMSHQNSCIIGHPKMHMRSVPVLEGYKSKVMMTTGSVTKCNYTSSKAGEVGSFHHTFGFVVVEIKDSEIFFIRQVTADKNGSFTDLYTSVENGKISAENTAEAIVLGDIHYGQHDEEVIETTFNVLFKKLTPRNVVLHDVMDSYSINHHELNNPFVQHRKEIDGTNSVGNEIEGLLEWLEKFSKYNVVIVKSNHDEFVDRWMAETDWRKQATQKNTIKYFEFGNLLVRGEAENGIVPYLINKKFPKFKCLGINDSFIVKNWELGQHGHVGTSGSRGSIQQYRKLNTRMVTAHSHQPCRLDGALSVGTSTKLRMSYNRGASAWAHSHVIINKFGKAQHIFFVKTKNGAEFTTF